jgi:hypothetical protein
MSPGDLGAAEYRRLWIEQSDRVVLALMAMDKVAEAVAVAQERLARLPHDPRVALGVAAELAWASIRVGGDHPAMALVLRRDCRQYTALAMKALWQGLSLCARTRTVRKDRSPSAPGSVPTSVP